MVHGTRILLTASLLLLTVAGAARAEWAGSVFVGYNQSSGNTDKGAGQIDVNVGNKGEQGEFVGKFAAFYSQTDNKMDGQKWDALAKYLLDFPDNSDWFTSYQLAAEHDRFADIDYRLTPAVGLGYHFSREEAWTWNADVALGYEITRHRTNTAADDEALVLIGHTFAKKQIFDNAFISEDLSLIPRLESGAGFRIKSETAFTNPINEKIDLEIKYIVAYDSEPAAGTTSTDKQLLAGVKYKF